MQITNSQVLDAVEAAAKNPNASEAARAVMRNVLVEAASGRVRGVSASAAAQAIERVDVAHGVQRGMGRVQSSARGHQVDAGGYLALSTETPTEARARIARQGGGR